MINGNHSNCLKEATVNPQSKECNTLIATYQLTKSIVKVYFSRESIAIIITTSGQRIFLGKI